MMKRKFFGIQYAFKGLADVFRSQPNMRIHAAAAVAVIALGSFFGISLMEWCIVVIAIGLVLMAEAFNTALEYLTDLVSPGHHPLAGKAKDAAAAGVLLSAIAAVVLGVCVFVPRIIRLLTE